MKSIIHTTERINRMPIALTYIQSAREISGIIRFSIEQPFAAAAKTNKLDPSNVPFFSYSILLTSGLISSTVVRSHLRNRAVSVMAGEISNSIPGLIHLAIRILDNVTLQVNGTATTDDMSPDSR